MFSLTSCVPKQVLAKVMSWVEPAALRREATVCCARLIALPLQNEQGLSPLTAYLCFSVPQVGWFQGSGLGWSVENKERHTHGN
jgi:hypothetical protein